MEPTSVTPPGWADSKDAWFGRVHDAILDSGMKVTYRDLSLAEFALFDALPTGLLELAVAEWAAPGATRAHVAEPFAKLPEKPTTKQQDAAEAETKQRFEQVKMLNRHVIAAALVEPKLTVDELEQVPMPDLERLSALINRTTAFDAAGRRVGVVPTDQFRTVLDAHGHEQCPPGCPACETARRALSTIR